MELIADLVRRRIPCCSQAARCSAGARFEHCRATSTTGRHPITDVGFCLPGCVRAVPVVVLLDAAGVPGAGGSGRPRDLATSLVRHRVSKPARALRSLRRPTHRRRLRYCVADVPALVLPPPTGTEAVPSGPSGVLHASGAWCVVVSTGFVSTSYAVHSSPCLACCWPQWYKVRPAHAKRAKTGHFE